MAFLSLQTTLKMWALVRNFALAATGTSSGSWACQQSFLWFTIASTVKLFLSENTWGDLQLHALMNYKAKCSRQLLDLGSLRQYLSHLVLKRQRAHKTSYHIKTHKSTSQVLFVIRCIVAWLTPSVVDNLWINTLSRLKWISWALWITSGDWCHSSLLTGLALPVKRTF